MSIRTCASGCRRALATGLALLLALAALEAGPRASANPASGTAAASLRPTTWRPVGPEGGPFRVLMPGEPTLRDGSRATILGRVHDAVYTLALGRISLAVEQHDVPVIAVLLLGADSIVDRVALGVVGDVRGTLLSEGPALVAGHPGRSLLYEIPGAEPSIEEARLLLLGETVYVLTAKRPRDEPADEAFGRFFDSFELLEEPAP